MPRQNWIPDILADAFRGVDGYRVEVYASAKTRGSDVFNPIGVMNHHTGPGSYDNLLRYMAVNSRIAPLCNWATSRPYNGVVRVTIVCTGKANHAGRGGVGLGGTPWIPTNDGNRRTIGGEHQNDGVQGWPAQQVEGIYIGSAALLEYLEADEDRAALHKTYAPGRKPDMHTVTLATHQAGIARYLKPTPAPAPTAEEDDDVKVKIAWFRPTTGSDKGMHCHRFTDVGVATYLDSEEKINLQAYLGAEWVGPLDPVLWQTLAVMNGPLKNT